MKTVAAIYTTQTLIDPVKALFREIMPEHRLVNVLDDSLIRDVISDGHVSQDVERRLFAYCRVCEDMGADLILETCSSVGEAVSKIQPFIKTKIIRIDQAMALQAVQTASSIAVLATLPTTLGPTSKLVNSIAQDLCKEVRIVEGLADGAFEALSDGNAHLHDEILMQAAINASQEADVILLAQGSMARMQDAIAKKTQKTVLSSLRPGLISVMEMLR